MEYTLLKNLFENKHQELHDNDLYKLVKDEIGISDFKKLITSFHERGFFDDSVDGFLISNIGINQYSSLKTQKDNQNKDIRLTELLNKINVVSGIVNFIFVPLTFILAIVAYSDKTKITELQSVINKQNKIIDSIKHNTPDNINNNKGFLIDSIKTDTVKK